LGTATERFRFFACNNYSIKHVVVLWRINLLLQLCFGIRPSTSTSTSTSSTTSSSGGGGDGSDGGGGGGGCGSSSSSSSSSSIYTQRIIKQKAT